MRCIVDCRPWCEPNRSGVGTYAAEITKRLVRDASGDAYALFANGASLRVPADMPKDGPGVIRRFTRYPNKLLHAAVTLVRRPRIEALAGPADAAFFPNFGFFSTALPYAVTVHDLSFVRNPEYFSPKQRAWHAAVRPALTLRRAAAIIAVSEHTRQDVIETYGIAPERVTVATPAADARFAPQTPSAIAAVRARYRLGDRPFYLFLATIEPRKNVLGLIDAYERIAARTDAMLVLAGGPGWGARAVAARVAASRFRDRIRMPGYVNDADKPALYAAAAAFVYPSFYEGFGIPPLEAMACGTPVVASRTSSLGEVCGDAAMLVDPRDADEIAEAMLAVREPRLAAELRRRGASRTTAFSWEKSAEIVRMRLVFASSAH